MSIERFAKVKRTNKQHRQQKHLHGSRNNKISYPARWSSRAVLQHRLGKKLLMNCKTNLPRLTNDCRRHSRWTIWQPFLDTRGGSQVGIDWNWNPWNYHFSFLLQSQEFSAGRGSTVVRDRKPSFRPARRSSRAFSR